MKMNLESKGPPALATHAERVLSTSASGELSLAQSVLKSNQKGSCSSGAPS